MRIDQAGKRKKQLGMSFGAACSLLRRNIIFMLAKKCGMDRCVRCKLKIVRPEDLSIEHVKNWLDVDPLLFWDMNNIAFSHKKCNITDRKGRHAKIGPPGTSWCSTHRDFLPVDCFTLNTSRFGGLQRECKECRSERQKEHPWRKSKRNGGV